MYYVFPLDLATICYVPENVPKPKRGSSEKSQEISDLLYSKGKKKKKKNKKTFPRLVSYLYH